MLIILLKMENTSTSLDFYLNYISMYSNLYS